MRVLVTGGPGAGKTTAARLLADACGAPLVDLDRTVAYRPPATDPSAAFARWERVPWDDRAATAAQQAGRDAWVAEGLYAGWTLPFAARADAVLWLDLPGWQAAAAVLRRQAGLIRGGHPDRYDARGTLQLARRAGLGYRRGPKATEAELRERDRANSRATTAAFLAPFRPKVVRCRSRAEARSAVAELIGQAG